MSDGQNQEISPATAQVGPLPATDFPTIFRIWNGNCICC